MRKEHLGWTDDMSVPKMQRGSEGGQAHLQPEITNFVLLHTEAYVWIELPIHSPQLSGDPSLT